MDEYAPPKNDKEWEAIIIQLSAFAIDQINLYNWFRGGKALPKGIEPEDIVEQTIFNYLENTSLYNPKKGTFLRFLKYYFLRRIVYNLAKSSENKINEDIFKFNAEGENGVENYENYLPVEILSIDCNIDLESIENRVIEIISGERILEIIFEGIYIMGMKRRDIIKNNNISETEFNNGVRRLNTILKTVKYQLGV